MEIRNLFDRTDVDHLISRINNLSPSSQAEWGKMNVSQMLAHSSVGFDSYYNPANYPAPSFFMKLMFKLFLKGMLTGPKPYKKNSRTAPHFIISDERDFEKEKNILIGFLNETHKRGASHFEGAESASFGPMTAQEWSTLWSKHLDHHLTQFGV